MGEQSNVQIDWAALDAAKPDEQALAAALVRFVRTRGGTGLPADELLSVRKAWLSFYPRLGFVEITDNSDPKLPRQLYALLDPDKDEATVLDMTNRPVYAVNKEHLRITSNDEAVRYVAFFFSCVAGPYGLMPVIEKLDLPPGVEEDKETTEALDKLRKGPNAAIPPSSKREGKSWRVYAALLFQGAVFKAEVVIDADGGIRVDKHEIALGSGGSGDDESAEPQA